VSIAFLASAGSPQFDDFVELLVYGIVIGVGIIALFILTLVLRTTIGSRIKNQGIPFGMSAEDIEKLKQKGNLTEEEVKKIRQAMGRKFIERSKEVEEASREPANAELMLKREEERLKAAGLNREEQPVEEDSASIPEPPDENHPKKEPLRPMPSPATETPPVESEARQPTAAGSLPEHLAGMVDRSEMELEELHSAGFLTEEDLERIRQAREDL